MDRAVLALARALKGGPTPLAGAVFPGREERGWRRVVTDAVEPQSGGTVFLSLQEPDGYPAGNQHIVQQLLDAGGEQSDDAEARAWWEDHWGMAAREGAEALATTGIHPPEHPVGVCRAVASWKQSLVLLRSVETLTGGSTRAIGWVEAPRETGCTIEWSFFGTREGAESPALVGYQLRETLRAHGARIETLHFEQESELPAYGVGGRGTLRDPSRDPDSGAALLSMNVRMGLEGRA